MHLSDFDYAFPPDLIAQYPLAQRDRARLMVINRSKNLICHDHFYNLPDYLPAKSLLVLNNSKVVHARLLGHRETTGGRVEVFLLRKLNDGSCYEAIISPLWKLKDSEKIVFNGSKIFAQVIDKENRVVRFNTKNIKMYLPKIGHVPLPPYIKRPDEPQDRKDYQTVYAKEEGSVASPTAGLHFTRPLLNKIKKSGHCVEQVTLHINHATFKPVEAENVTEHKMHYEEYSLSARTLKNVQKAKDEGRKVVAVGTTSARVLETVALTKKRQGQTNLFIYPGFQIRMVDVLVTNFHLPKSTLFILTCAFGGTELIKKAYAEAVKEKYRFYSYGDAMIIK